MTHAPTTRRALLAFTVASAATAGLAGCSLFGVSSTGGAGANGAEPAPAESMPPLESSRTLVAYFSVPETADAEGMTQDEENSTHVVEGTVYGNTEYVALLMAERLGGDPFRIETAEQLPLDHDTLIALANEWIDADARPELKSLIPDLDAYDTVIVGYPIWEYDMPIPLYSFFEQHDFTGKNVYIYTTHDVSGISGTLETVARLLPTANVSENTFDISRNDMDRSEAEVGAWLDTLPA